MASINVVVAVISQLSDSDFYKCLFSISYSVLVFRHRKMSVCVWCKLVFRPKPTCSILSTCACLLSIGFCWWTNYMGVFYVSPSWTDGNRCVPMNSFKSILLVLCFLLVSVYSLPLRVFVFNYCSMDCEDKNINTDVFRFGANPAHLFNS